MTATEQTLRDALQSLIYAIRDSDFADDFADDVADAEAVLTEV